MLSPADFDMLFGAQTKPALARKQGRIRAVGRAPSGGRIRKHEAAKRLRGR